MQQQQRHVSITKGPFSVRLHALVCIQPSVCAPHDRRLAAKQSLEDAGAAAVAEWRTLAALLAQMLHAYLSAMPGTSRDEVVAASEWLWAPAASIGLIDRCAHFT